MPQQASTSLQNNFIGGLKTEFTGLNFPENACTDADNVIFTIVGDVTRRGGFDYESNFGFSTGDRTLKAVSSYKWNNVGGDGSTQIVVTQVGNTLSFYRSSTATTVNPLSTQALASTVTLSNFSPTGAPDPSLTECQYTDGNGYLFVFHPNLDPFYCTYAAGVITANVITVQIRDFAGIPEPGVADTYRPSTLTPEHNYNLINQGWTNALGWSTTSTTSFNINNPGTGSYIFTGIPAGLSIVNGDTVSVVGTYVYLSHTYTFTLQGTVTSYAAPNLTVLISGSFGQIPGSGYTPAPNGTPVNSWTLSHVGTQLINTWHTAINNYPSNADVWWQFKDSSNIFLGSNPPTSGPPLVANVTLSTPAPKGSIILNAFQQQRSALSGVLNVTDVTTLSRPKTGTWYQGRVWYSGVDASFPGAGDMPFSTWSENIYFSQIITGTTQFGKCFEVNDPTSETLFDLLPSDGGVIQIQGCGSIYKLFPLKFGLVVFAANGVWFIGGSAGTGFTATDYTVTKISNIQSISGTSIVNVQGFPMFWNEEGIYHVSPAQQGGSAHSPDIALDVSNLCLGTILTFYDAIPVQSKKFARGDFHPLDYVVQWLYRDTNETDITSRYQFNRVMNFNIATKAFYTYTLGTSATSPYAHCINYVAGPGGSTSPSPTFKYFTSKVTSPAHFNFTFSEERDFTNWYDWGSTTPIYYTSQFTSGYSLKGKGITKFQVPYLYMFSRNPALNEYTIQSIWDYAGTGNSGRWSVRQVITNNNANFTSLYRKHRLRGRGLAMQLRVSSVQGLPFDLMGWSVLDEVNQGI